MSIEYLRLKGFKSFGVSCEFTFSEGLTAIVGPNGSGKSNILDGLRWVLGEGSPSVLRIVRQSDLVFQGSATVDPAKEAEVLLKLNNKESTASLRRSYTSENGSLLQVDGNKIRMQDIAEFKARFMLEGDAFAFIGQGEVAEAIHQRPMQRRHHLELLFGIDRYRKRREETYYKLEAALDEVQRINTLVQELENRRAEIAPEVVVAVEAKGIIDNLENMRKDFYFSRRFSLENKQKEYKSHIQILAEHADQSSRWLNLWRHALALAEEEMRSKGFDEQKYLTKEREYLLRKEALSRQAFAASTRIRVLLSERFLLIQEINLMENNLTTVKNDIQTMQENEQQLSGLLAGKRVQFDTLLQHLEENKAQAERERLRRQALRDEHAAKTLQISKNEAQLKAFAVSEEENKAFLINANEKRLALAALTSKLLQEVAAQELLHEKLVKSHSDAYASCQKQAASLQQLRRELTRQEAELDAAKENTEASIYPEPTRLLLAASRLGKMKSKPEVVAEAFSCPSEIASALEAYLGGRQFWLLVKTLDEAQEGIELLKQRRAGRVTYLPLEKCHPRFPDTRFRLPLDGVIGWGLELITPRSPWELALQHLLGDILIVRDYSLGAGMVKNGAKFPIVTLEGEVFAPSGTVSGGRMRHSGGAISHNQKIGELAVLTDSIKQKIKTLENTLKSTEKEEQKEALERDRISSLLLHKQNELLTSQRALAALEADVARLGAENEQAAIRSTEINMHIKTDLLRLSELESEISNFEDVAETGELSSVASSLRNEIELFEERLRGQQSLLLRAQKESNDLEGRVLSVQKNLEDGKAEERNLRTQLKEIGCEYLFVFNSITELRAALNTEKTRFYKMHRRLEKFREKERHSGTTLVSLQAEITSMEERIGSVCLEVEHLQEMWDEKFPYDLREASAIEGGKDLINAMKKLERELKALGSYNLGALSEDESLIERIDYLAEQLEDVKSGVDELKGLIDETDAQVETLFAKAMTDIDDRFNALFQRLFAGGEARLTLQEEGSIWERGVEIYARPPGKRLQNISQLSGGEQSLTAIAHLFAALEVAQMPLAVLDEVDAALDEYNLIRFADLAKEYSKRLQLLVMTHRRTTMERADLIYGVTMVEPGLSKIVGIDVENYR